jgi:dihydrofolate synthase/folylpolyglutamate synthase
VLVVGTNGKGSTAVMLERVVAAHPASTALYTSPHLVRVEERLRIGGLTVTRPELELALAPLDAHPDLTYFEALTAAALLHCASSGVGCAVLEAGMGGRWDATRVAGSAVVGLTNVGTDHRAWLGPDRAAIAADKGAALAAAEIAVLGPGVEDEIVPSLGAPRAIRASDLVRLAPLTGSRVRVEWDTETVEVDVPLAGRHQLDNLHLALALARAAGLAGLTRGLSVRSVVEGLAGVSWPGRLSRHRIGHREVLLDGAHNREAAEALAAHLAMSRPRYNLLFSCLDDKPVDAMAATLRPWAGRVAVCPLNEDRGLSLDRLMAAFPGAKPAPDPWSAFDLLPDPVLATGSLRLVGALLERERPAELTS